jgi:hypothetical protein
VCADVVEAAGDIIFGCFPWFNSLVAAASSINPFALSPPDSCVDELLAKSNDDLLSIGIDCSQPIVSTYRFALDFFSQSQLAYRTDILDLGVWFYSFWNF